MKTVVVGFFVGALVASTALLSGCNNGTCTYVSKCVNDGPTSPVQEQDNTTLCNNRKSDSLCGGYYNDYIACFQSNQTCTSTGVTDYTITDGLCGAQYAKWQDCYYGTDGGGFADAASE
jgi:hypothetical protein